MHIDIQSPCQSLEVADNKIHHTENRECPTREKASAWCKVLWQYKEGKLKMWFSVEGLQYSKMLLFLLSVPFTCSESGLLT